ncbi:hypothetical protein VR45_31120 [Streptomyces sp. NRRL S-495]|nr:hypothetical protein VR45_31120 [Streptomyces sp. NRRL S-495]
MHVTPFVPPAAGRGPWPEGAEEVLVGILLGFDRMLQLTFRQDVLATMGASAKTRGIQADIREDYTPRPHVREMLRAIRAFRDPWAALDALAEALEELARNDGARDWLELARRVLNRGEDLPRGELLAVIGELHEITAPTRPARHLPEDIPGLRERDTAEMTLPALLDLLVNRIDDDPLGPLVAFLRALGDNPEVTRQHPLPALRRFLAAHAYRAPAVAAAVPGERLIVQVRLDEEGPVHTGDTRYRLHISYYRQPLTGGPFRRVGSHQDDQAFTRSELLGAGGARLVAWKELKLALRTTDPVRIEFLLPRSILGYTAELWSTGATRRPLGEFHPVVVRQLERYCEPHLGLALWRQRWANLQSHGVDSNEVIERIEWPSLDRASAKELLNWVTGRKNLACLGLTVPYEQLDPEVQYAVDDAMYFEGIPVLIWRRVAGDPDPLVAALRQHRPTRLAELPDAVHRYRRQVGGPNPDPDRTVTLLWDDPDCVDPDQDYAFPGIVE